MTSLEILRSSRWQTGGQQRQWQVGKVLRWSRKDLWGTVRSLGDQRRASDSLALEMQMAVSYMGARIRTQVLGRSS